MYAYTTSIGKQHATNNVHGNDFLVELLLFIRCSYFIFAHRCTHRSHFEYIRGRKKSIYENSNSYTRQ